MSDSSFANLATSTATTKRNPAAVGGKVGAAVGQITTPFAIIPPVPDPADNNPQLRLNSMRQGWVCYYEGTQDIRKGDILTTGGTDYRVDEVHPWPILIEWTEVKLEKVL